MMANATDIATTGDDVQDGVGALGVLFAGVVCFAVASITPLVLYKLMPTVEGAVVGAGVAGGWGRGAMTGMYAASTAKNLGGSVTKLASGSVPGGRPTLRRRWMRAEALRPGGPADREADPRPSPRCRPAELAPGRAAARLALRVEHRRPPGRSPSRS